MTQTALRSWCVLVAGLVACANVAGSSGVGSRGDASVDGSLEASSGAEASSTSSSSTSSSGGQIGPSTSSSSGARVDCDADLQTDPRNCGGCGTACPTSSVPGLIAVCSRGGCNLQCRAGTSPCLGRCVSFETPDNCGSCDNICGVSPDGGVDDTTLCAPSGGGYACVASCPPNAPTNCHGACVDTTSTAIACGPSCTACATDDPHGQPACVNSTCAVSCLPGYTLCDGRCVSPRTPDHCGSCGVACNADSGTTVCSLPADGGPPSCAPGCPLGQTDCRGTCVDRSTDPSNCGSCDNACGSPTAGNLPTCSQGRCVAACAAGYTLCGGACVDTTISNANCGSCGNVCGIGTVCIHSACMAGCIGCDPSCPSFNDPNNCGCGWGRCETNVTSAHATCVSGLCSFACDTGYTLCSGACVDELTDDNNCGACGAPCTPPGTCQGGHCK